MFSSVHLVDYTSRYECINNFIKDEQAKDPIDSLQLSYASLKEQGNQVSKVANSSFNSRQQHVPLNELVLNNQNNPGNNMFEVQLLYDINQALDPKSWDSNFHTVSLHGSLEHFVSDIKLIKEFFKRMQKYILNKSIIGDKANDVKNLKSMGEVAWEFILALYKSKWDYLIVDKNNFSFR